MVQHAIEDFKNGGNLVLLINYGARLLKIYDYKRVIKWNWQSLDSISVKSPLKGDDWT